MKRIFLPSLLMAAMSFGVMAQSTQSESSSSSTTTHRSKTTKSADATTDTTTPPPADATQHKSTVQTQSSHSKRVKRHADGSVSKRESTTDSTSTNSQTVKQ